MINLRYHIVSIAAVFLALAIGLALGSTFVDSVLVSNLESRVDQLQADTEQAVERSAEAQAARDEALAAQQEALANVERVRAERVELEELVRPYLAQGRLGGTMTLIIAARTVDPATVAAVRDRIAATQTRFGGVLWISEELRLNDEDVRAEIAEAYSLAGNSRAAVQRALNFLVPQALFRPAEAGSSGSSVSTDISAAIDTGALEGFSRGFAAVPQTRTALTVLRDLGLVSHDGTGAVALHLLGGDNMRLVVVTDAAAAGLNEGFLFEMLRSIAQDGHVGTGVIVEVPAGGVLSGAYGAVIDRVRSDTLLAASFSTVNDADTFLGDLALLTALTELPDISHYSSSVVNHGLGPQ